MNKLWAPPIFNSNQYKYFSFVSLKDKMFPTLEMLYASQKTYVVGGKFHNSQLYQPNQSL